jgi:hypothetical protein
VNSNRLKLKEEWLDRCQEDPDLKWVVESEAEVAAEEV